MTFRRALALAAVALSLALPLFAARPAGAAAAAGPAGQWRPVGPLGGRVTAPAGDPSHPATVLAVSYFDGIFHSADGGDTWDRSGPDNTFTSQVVFDPRHRGTAYAATESSLYKTTDGGKTWAFAIA